MFLLMCLRTTLMWTSPPHALIWVTASSLFDKVDNPYLGFALCCAEEYNTRLTDERNEEEATEAEEISPSSSSSSSSSPYTLENFFWIVTALIVFYYTDFYAVVINDQRIYRQDPTEISLISCRCRAC